MERGEASNLMSSTPYANLSISNQVIFIAMSLLDNRTLKLNLNLHSREQSPAPFVEPADTGKPLPGEMMIG